MKDPSEPYLAVERPNSTAVIDLLDIDTSVRISVEAGKVWITVSEQNAEDSSYFNAEDFVFELQHHK